MIYEDYLSIRATKFAWLGAIEPQKRGRGRPIEDAERKLNEMCLNCPVPDGECYGECKNIAQAKAKQAGIVLRNRGREPKGAKKDCKYKSMAGEPDPCLSCKSASICKAHKCTCNDRVRWERDNAKN